MDHLFSALVLPNFTYGLPVYGAVDLDLTVIQNFLDRYFKRKYPSERTDIRELLENADKKLFKVRLVDPDCPLSNIIPKKKETKYLLRNKSAHRPDIKTDRFKNVFVHYGTAPVDPCRPQNRGSHHYLRAHKGSRRSSCPLIQDSSVRVLFP